MAFFILIWAFPFPCRSGSWFRPINRYDGNPECAYDPARLNFAIHVRMGDRPIQGEEGLDYFHLLELFMDTVSKEVVRKGLEPPLFHVFSETLIPCPSQDTGLFHEFPTWPVHQVRTLHHRNRLCLLKYTRYEVSTYYNSAYLVPGRVQYRIQDMNKKSRLKFARTHKIQYLVVIMYD